MKHVLLIVKLRWMLFKNSLRSRSGCTELLSAMLLGLLLIPLDIVLSVALGAIAYTLYGQPFFVPAVSCILAGITVAWQVIPLLTASLGNDADIDKFRQYPLSTAELFAIDVALGAFDPLALLAYPSIAAVLFGCVARSPRTLPLSITTVGLFVAFNIFLSRYTHRLISALLSNRKRREVIAVLILLLVFIPQIILSVNSRNRTRTIAERSSDPTATVDYARKTVTTFGKYLAWLPPGLAARNLMARADAVRGFNWLALLAAAAFGFAVGSLEYNRLIRDYYGRMPRWRRRATGKQRDKGTSRIARNGDGVFETGRLEAKSKEPTSGLRLSLLDKVFPWLPSTSTAILEKEIKYFYRSPRAFLIFLGPLLGAIVFIMPSHLGAITAKAENYRLSLIVLYSVFLDTQIFSNAFGFDWHGAKLYFMAPTKGQAVLFGKNLAALCIMGAQIVGVMLLFAIFTGPVNPIAIVDALFAFVISVPMSLTVGNYLSVLYPRAIDFSKVYGRSYSHVSQFFMLLDLPLMAAVVGAGPVIGLILDSSTITYIIFAGEAVLAAVVYWVTLRSAGNLMEGRAESFLQSLLARS
jgi:hypothetical protein